MEKLFIFIIIIVITFSCNKNDKNEFLVQKYCKLELTRAALIYTNDTLSNINTAGRVINLQVSYSIKNNSNLPIFIQFSNLYNKYNFKMYGFINGHEIISFYNYPFMFNFKENPKANRSIINPGELVKGTLSSPILDVIRDNSLLKLNKWYNDLDSLKLYMVSVKDSNIIQYFNVINLKKDLIPINPPCINNIPIYYAL